MEYSGCQIALAFQVGPDVPDHYIQEEGGYKKGMAAWIDNKHPLLGPEQFKEYVCEHSKEVFSGEPDLRAQAVIQGTAVHGEWQLDREDVEYGFNYLVAFYWKSGMAGPEDEKYRRAESLMSSDLERHIDDVNEMFSGIPYEVGHYTLIPHETGTKPLDEDKERY